MSRNPGDNKPGTGPGNGTDRNGQRHDAGTSSARENTPGRQGTAAEPENNPKAKE